MTRLTVRAGRTRARWATAACLLLLAACQGATVGPRSNKNILSDRVDAPEGWRCVDAWVDVDSALGRAMLATEPAARCWNRLDDVGSSGAMMNVGRPGRDDYDPGPLSADTVMAELVLYDDPPPFMGELDAGLQGPGDFSMLPRSGGTAYVIAVPATTTVGGHRIRLFASAMPRPGALDRLVCVGAADVTTRRAFSRICRTTTAADADAMAARIIAEDVPAIHVWPVTTWEPGT